MNDDAPSAAGPYLERVRSWIEEDVSTAYRDLIAVLSEGLEPEQQAAALSVALKKAWIAGYDRSTVEAAALLIRQGEDPPRYIPLRDRDIDL